MEEYYHRLKWRLRIGILVAFMVPLAILSVYFHFQFNVTLKETGKQHLAALAESQRNTIDLFLQERVVNIFNLFHGADFRLPPSEEDMGRYLQQLLEMNNAFADVSFLNASGVQVGYAGPYAHLRGKDYSAEDWFRTLMQQNRNYYISDIYLGFRNEPHFTIAVKQVFDGRPCIMRAALDPNKFYLFLRNIGKANGVESALINREGRFQVVDPARGTVLAFSSYMPTQAAGSDAHEVKNNGDSELFAFAWLGEVPWVLVIRQPLKIAYADMYRVRRFMIVITIVLSCIAFGGIWLTTGKLLQRAQATDKSRKELKGQLFHAAKLVAAGELAAGVAHEINNPLAIISSQSGVVRDMLDPQFGMECTPESIGKELDYIDEAVFRARDITQKLLNLVRKMEPHLEPCNLNTLIDDVISGLKEKEFAVSDIEVVRDYEPNLPEIMFDPDQMRQVFLNLINNAGDAIVSSGKITLSTRSHNGQIEASVADTGKGMTSDQIGRIFDPFYTTKEVGRGTGLGLSISLGIVQSMGGRIEVQSVPGAGSLFTVVLPLNEAEEN
jgi:two-component system NtrC family sensor kinase